MNPAMITLARECRGWTQKDLAVAINTVQGTISKYEAHLLPVAPHHEAAICHVLQFKPEFFYQDAPVLGLGGDFLYRKKASAPAKALRRVQAQANIRRLQVAELLRHVQPPDSQNFPAIQPEEMANRVERVAREVRRALRVPRGPIRNVTRVIESAGAIVFTTDFETDSIDGTNIRRPGEPPLLFLNRNVSGERHRFNLAHEVAHVVMHFSVSLNDAEEEANHFAREFLMPFDEIRSDLTNLDLSIAARLKQVWGVSIQAIITHARRLRKITESQYRRMFTQLSASGYRKAEPMPLPFEQPELFAAMQKTFQEKVGECHMPFADDLGELPVPAANPQLRLVEPNLFEQDQPKAD